jgi:outer membrane protein TolC
VGVGDELSSEPASLPVLQANHEPSPEAVAAAAPEPPPGDTAVALPERSWSAPAQGIAGLPCREAMPIDLLTALTVGDANNPVIALARDRVREAYFLWQEAKVAWLPTLQAGPQWNRHDGQIQNSTGLVFTTSKQNLYLNGGGTLIWDAPTVLFGPLIARRLVEAQQASSRAVTDNVQLDIALTYLDLLQIYGELAVNADTLARAEDMMRLAESAERAGLGKTAADANRARTEVNLRRQERIDMIGQAAVISARLARLLLLQPTVDLRPVEPTVVPITLVPPCAPLEDLVALGLQQRPEVVEGQALAGAAQARWRQAKLAPFLPHFEATYYGGYFGGGIDDQLHNFSARSDGTLQAYWRFRNLGAGDVAEARVRKTQFSEANWNVVDVQSRVAEEVTAAAKVVETRLASLASAQRAVEQAQEMWRRLRTAAFGLASETRRYDPLEPLLAEQALNQARMGYLNEVIEYNKSQFRLYWALGKPPLCALPKASPQPVDVPVVPIPPYSPPDEQLPGPRRLNEPNK